MADLLIHNGMVIDGSGSPGFFAAVAVDGDTVSVHRGDVSHIDAARVIDAAGHVVCPGFVGIHSHAGLTILGEPHHDPKVRQGVTTELVGIDGISHAPFKTQEELHRYIWLDSGLNGYPPLPADWLTVAGLLGKYDNNCSPPAQEKLRTLWLRLFSQEQWRLRRLRSGPDRLADSKQPPLRLTVFVDLSIDIGRLNCTRFGSTIIFSHS